MGSGSVSHEDISELYLVNLNIALRSMDFGGIIIKLISVASSDL